MVQHAWAKIDAEFALNEYSYILPTPSGVPVFQIQTAEKVPTRFKMTITPWSTWRAPSTVSARPISRCN
jgi:hypothetical protein